MKKIIFFTILFLSGMIFSLQGLCIEDKKSVAILPLDVQVNSSSYAIYSNTQDLFSADLVNSLQQYKDLDVIDVNSSEKIIALAGLQKQYEKMVKDYKKRYILDYEKADMIAQALGVNYIVFVHGGLDTERAFLKSNWKYRCQWIWASQIKNSVQFNMNITLVDMDKRTYALEENVKKDISMNDFGEPSNVFAENYVPIAALKKVTKPNSIKIAQKIHSAIYPFARTKYAQRNAFVEKFIPNNDTYYENQDYQQNSDIQPVQNDNNFNTDINNSRKESYKNWVEQQL